MVPNDPIKIGQLFKMKIILFSSAHIKCKGTVATAVPTMLSDQDSEHKVVETCLFAPMSLR